MNDFERRRAYAEAFRLLDRADELLADARRKHMQSVKRAQKKAA